MTNMDEKNTPRREELITLTQAAELLGYKNFRRINSFIKKGLLKAYFVATERYKLVKKEDVLDLNEVKEWRPQ
jgi:hypothetical protein